LNKFNNERKNNNQMTEQTWVEGAELTKKH
jgi:hypothetical protein